MYRSSSLLAFALVSLTASVANADTVAAEAAKGACATGGVIGLSDQLVKVQICLAPGTFVDFTPHTNVTVTSTSVKPFLLVSARDALWKASASLDLKINSAFRTLADQYVLYYSGGCGLAAKPGMSNHETGKAVDLENWSAATGAMTSAGCTHTYPSTDPVHFDCPGIDDRADSIKAFQHLWNVNNPGDLLTEDGSYGPATESRLAKSPAGGFADPADCAKKGPDWAAEFVDQSFPKAATGGVLTMIAGSATSGFIEMKNVGVKAWDSKTFLATTMPRDRSSPFVGTDWSAPHRPAGVGGVVSPGGTHKLVFTLHAPDKLGDYDEHFGMVEEGVAWFSDPGEGGPADGVLQIKIKVVAASSDGGVDAEGSDASSDAASDGAMADSTGDDEGAVATDAAPGCACRANRGNHRAGAGAWLAIVGLCSLLVRKRRRRALAS